MATSDCCCFLHDFCDALIKETESSVLWNGNSSYYNFTMEKYLLDNPTQNP